MLLILHTCGPFALLILGVLLRLIATTRPETSWSGSQRSALIMVSYMVTAIALLGMFFLLFVQPLLGIIGMVLAGLLTVTIIETEIRFAGLRNRSRQAELLWVLAVAVRSGRPLPDEIESYARGVWGKRHRLLTEMADRLREGQSLTEVVVPQGLLPASAAMQIHAGIVSQSFPEALMQTAERVTEELADDQEPDFPGAGLAYPAALIVVISLIVAFLMYWIIPKFKKIFDDFGTELPDATLWLIRCADVTVNYWYILGLPAFFYVPVAICVFVGMAEYYGWTVLLQSILGRWFVRWHTPDILRALSQSVIRELPIDQGLLPIIRFAGPLKLRRQLTVAADAIEDGAASWQSLEAVGVLKSSESVILESAQRIGNLPWAMETVADNIERRRAFRLKVLLEFLQPMMLIPVGILVGLIAWAFFLPLIKLLTDLS